jgi:CDP-paratose 2-epimerase
MSKVAVIGGAGFIGMNTALRHSKLGDNVVVIDNMSRKGTEHNLEFLIKNIPKERFSFKKIDIRSPSSDLDEVIKESDIVYNFAAQVAVIPSLQDPKYDLEVNILGNFNVLESIRNHNPNIIFIFTSTNKVYGCLEHKPVIEKNTRYEFADGSKDISETEQLQFASPYGCSKGSADQYTLDYAKMFGLKTVVFRQSCIYGPHQFGVEDQGWVAYFLIAAHKNKPLTLYGTGKQVRDLLYVDDLIDAYLASIQNIAKTSGQAYNVGGGVDNTLSLIEFVKIIPEYIGKEITPTFAEVRPGDQPIFISNNAKAYNHFGWKPKTTVREGLRNLSNWIKLNDDKLW